MRTIGVRELRQQASKWLRRVEQGESFEVTCRGRTVALLTPIPRGSVLERLEREGALHRGEGDLLEKQPLPPTPNQPLPSEALEALRADER